MAELQEISLDYIQPKIQAILDRNHSQRAKREIKRFPSDTHPDRLNFACPICGDSQKSNYKKRGNLYLANLKFICYNCDEKMSFVKLCERFNETINIEDKVKIYNYIDTHTTFNRNNEEYILDSLDKLISIDNFITFFNEKPNSWLCDISPIQPNSVVNYYLKNRYIVNTDDFFEGTYRVIRDGRIVFKTKVVISLNRCGDKLAGIQLRNLEKDKDKRFYKIVDFEELYNFMNPTNILDDSEAIQYNKLSHFFNILNVDIEKEITVFEGFIDSKFFPNSVGMVGARNDKDLLKFLLNSKDDLKLRFFYDNDATGLLKSYQMLKDGYNVFLWKKLFEKLSKKNYYESKKKLENVIDLNDLVIRAKNPYVYSALKLDNYFSIDSFDIRFIDKVVFNKEKRIYEILKSSF